MNLSNLPDVKFVTSDAKEVEKELLSAYKQITGRDLASGDPIRLFILTIAYIIVMLLNKINETGRQNLLRYATGGNLDNLAAFYGVERQPGAAATLTEKFTLSAAMPFNITIPQGTRVSNGSQIYFATKETLVIKMGETTGTVACICQTVGEAGNGFAAGTVTTLVDPVAYVAAAINTTTSEGGADAEQDDSLRLRTAEAPESFSTAGPSGAYEYWAKAASTLIEQAKAVSPEPGCVDVYILESSGKLPGEELRKTVLDYLSDEKRRPLTDKVSVKAPMPITYDLSMTYYLAEDVNVEETRRQVETAIQAYLAWQDSKMGRDINPNKLVQLCLAAGAKRLEITSPVFTRIKEGTAADDYVVGIAKNSGTNVINFGGTEDE